MNKFSLSIFCSLFSLIFCYSQTVSDIINAVNLDSLSLTVKEFSGEQPTIVNGNTVTILNRKQANNNLAAEYLFEKLDRLDNLSVAYQIMNDDDQRRNVIATQLGTTHPENVYIICAHYDSVTDYCADDNASGVAAVIEVARVLSGQCLENTIIYALWDEEEIGLIGSKYYAELEKTNGEPILGVYNLDMIGYDGDNDQSFDIDVKKDDAGSQGMSDDIVAVLNSYPFKLNANIIIPGTEYSDHSSFWNRGYPAVLIGEAWSENDENPEYHSSNDRFELFNTQFFHEISKLSAGFMATKAVLTGVDNSVSVSAKSLKANQDSAVYQWYNCTTGLPISGETAQVFEPTENGDYQVEITSGDCSEFSACYTFETLGLPTFTDAEITLYPNPVKTNLQLEILQHGTVDLDLFDSLGKLVLHTTTSGRDITLSLSNLPSGVYYLTIENSKKRGSYKIIKD
ncbi:M28 family peptidase [Formosa haliotis]|uniref:M28 family peptidase n=1 Tax=Formosa haliotis TaxID=1555194 RepID=UPI000825CD03|nr:M28 family peptidase [Formosa haliotis]